MIVHLSPNAPIIIYSNTKVLLLTLISFTVKY